MDIVKTGSAAWQGGIKDGTGQISTETGALRDQPFGFNTRFEGKPGTNPEELIGAAHAGCFSMALSKALGEAGVTNVRIDTTSAITLVQKDGGFAITRAHLTTTIRAKGDEATIRKAAEDTKMACPVSKLLNAEITMEARIHAA